MFYVIIGLGVLFFVIGFILTENNAKYLLSGYNTMSEEERKNFDLQSFIPFYRNFHIFLAISFTGLGLLFNAVNPTATGIFLATYPILAYMYFIWKSKEFEKGNKKSNHKIAIYVLGATLVFVLALLGTGFKEDALTIENEKINISGSYGEEVTFDNIASVQLIDQLPKITMKTNGFSLGEIKKGYFKSSEGKVKLILNSNKKPYLKITKKNGKAIFYTEKDKSSKGIFDQLKTLLPREKIKQM